MTLSDEEAEFWAAVTLEFTVAAAACLVACDATHPGSVAPELLRDTAGFLKSLEPAEIKRAFRVVASLMHGAGTWLEREGRLG